MHLNYYQWCSGAINQQMDCNGQLLISNYQLLSTAQEIVHKYLFIDKHIVSDLFPFRDCLLLTWKYGLKIEINWVWEQ